MKTKINYLIVLFVLAIAAPKANAQTLIQYWDFNGTLPAAGGGGDSLGNSNATYGALTANQVAKGLTAGHIIYSRPTKHYNSGTRDSILDNGSGGAGVYDFSNSNDTGGTAAGNLFVRARNPADSCVMYVYIPTTGYKNIQFEFALSASSTKGANYGIFSYSTNNGTSWNNLTKAMDTFNISGVYRPDTLQLLNPISSASAWYPVHINFSSDPTVNSNANVIVRMMLAGPNTHQQASGNARFDNFAVLGTIVAGVNEISAEAAGYSVYPNPVGDFVNVVSSQYTGAKVITLYNVVGQEVSQTQTSDLQTAISTSSLNSGMYFVEIQEVATGNKYTQKIVK